MSAMQPPGHIGAGRPPNLVEGACLLSPQCAQRRSLSAVEGVLAWLRVRMRRLLTALAPAAQIDKAMELEGWKLLLLVRLSPLVPYNLLNICMAATKIHFWAFAVVSFFGADPKP